MKSIFIEKEALYDGTQLRSQFTYLSHGILGDSIAAWVGPCNIPFEHMVDGEDFLDGSAICGSKMLHFIVEKFGINLFAAVGLQRLLASLSKDLVSELYLEGKFRRDGDDVYLDRAGQTLKLSISIATVTPVSAMIHFAVNISNKGTPVPTCALEDFAVDPKTFALELMKRFSAEVSQINEATMKVRWVR